MVFHFQKKSVLSAKSKASASVTNIPPSPVVQDQCESTKSSRRKLPAPKPKTAITETMGSPGLEKENDNPVQSRTENIPASSVDGKFLLRDKLDLAPS